MILEVTQYGNPVLRQKGERIREISAEIKQLIADMFETMHHAQGIGLAAQQVGRALQLAVIDISVVNEKDRPSFLEIDGKTADPNSIMPLVLINPELKLSGELTSSGEGCLSFPDIYGEISRPGTVDVTALNEKGEQMKFRCRGLLSRAVQHEVDHLNGLLFIDRMDKPTKLELKPELDALQTATKAALKKKN